MLSAESGQDQDPFPHKPSSIHQEFLKAEEAKYFLAAIVESSQDSIVTINFEGIITTWNRAAQYLYGYSAEEAIGQPLTMLTFPEDLRELQLNIERVKHSYKVEMFEPVRLNKDGHTMDLEVVMSPVKDAAGQVVGVSTIARDITFRKEAEETRRQLEEARRELVRHVVNTQEEERGRISRELHDNLGQHLTAVMLGLQNLETQMTVIIGDKGKSETSQLDTLRTLVDGLMQATHRQARELRPAELDAMGLDAALRQYTRDWSERCGVEVDFEMVNWLRRIDPEVETTLYRVVQEALNNVARHAGATWVSIVLEQRQESAHVIIEDNGCGFDTEQSTGRLGVLGMRERLAMVRGTLEIESIPGDGTSVFARVPLPQYLIETG